MDRELNAWVAENVFRYETREHPVVGGIEIDTGLGFDPLPNYTSDMNEAVKVLKNIGGWLIMDSVTGQLVHAYPTPDYWDSPFKFRAPTDDPAMAICLATYKLETGEDWDEN